MRTAVILDTNVAIASNGKTDQASPECIKTCIERLRRVRAHEKVVLDDGGRILEEYRRRLSPAGYHKRDSVPRTRRCRLPRCAPMMSNAAAAAAHARGAGSPRRNASTGTTRAAIMDASDT